MNRLLYRIIFSKTRGLLMVVADIARSGRGWRTRRGRGLAAPCYRGKLSPLRFALWLAAGVVSLPARADIIADHSAPGSQQATVLSTANGLPQVNIQTPGADGVSRNQYSQFDVGERGAILNNSQGDAPTQLAGHITGNPWLAKQEATIILNEVNSRDPSRLNGFIEVAGRRAEVVIASPAGITCNGCGFINAERATLAAGQARMDGGRLKGFEVRDGRIRIEGRGLNAGDANHTALIARAVEVNARVHAAGELRVTAGRNETDAAGRVTRVSAGEDGSKPAFALDVAALGGMYANKIVLEGTEKGVGVHNAGELGAMAGELSLSADGQLVNSGMLSGLGDLKTAVKGDMHNTGSLAAGGSLALSVSGTLRNDGLIRGGQDVFLTAAATDSTARGTLAAGTDEKGVTGPAGDLVLSAQGELKAQGQNLAGGRIVAGGSRVDFGGSRTRAKHITLTAAREDVSTAGAVVRGHEGVSLQSPVMVDNTGGSVSGGTLSLQAPGLNNTRGLLRQEDGQALSLSHAVLHNNQGTLVSGGSLALRAERIENQGGSLAANGRDMQVEARILDNRQGTVQLAGDGQLQVQADELHGHEGALLATGALRLTGRQTDLSAGRTRARQITAETGSLNNDAGTLSARGSDGMQLTVTGGLSNRGGRAESAGPLAVKSGRLDNAAGTLLAAGSGDLTLTTTADIVNAQGKLLAGRHVTLSADRLDNQAGLISATGGRATLSSRQALSNEQGRVEAKAALTLTGGGLTNTGGTVTGGDISIDVRKAALNNLNGQVAARGGLTLMSASLDNTAGVMAATGDVRLSTGRLGNDGGKFLTDSTLTLNTGDVTSRAGLFQAGGSLRLDTAGGTLTSTDSGDTGGIIAGEDLTLSTGALEGAGGLLQGRNITLDTHGQALNHAGGRLSARETARLSTGLLDNTRGLLRGGTALVIDTHGQRLTSRDSGTAGGIVSGGSLQLSSGALDNRDGVLVSQGDARLTTAGLDNIRGRMVSETGSLRLTSREVNNEAGLLQAGATLALDTQGQRLINTHSAAKGGIIAAGDLSLTAAGLDNRGGRILADGSGTLHTTSLTNTGGQIAGNGGLSVTGGALNNAGGRLQSGADLSLDTGSAALGNAGGTVAGDGGVRVTAGRLDNRQGTLASGGAARLYLQDSLDNTAGLVHAGGALDVAAREVNNRETRPAGKGLEGTTLNVTTGRLDNTAGALRATEQLTATVRRSLENVRGMLSSQGDLRVQDAQEGRVLAVNNREGVLIADREARMAAASLSGDGQVLSQGTLDIRLKEDFHLTGAVKANGDLQLVTDGSVVSDGTLAGLQRLTLAARNITNGQRGDISAQETRLLARETLTNTGLVDGGLTYLQAATLNNSGTGRIFGDHVAIEAGTLNNLKAGEKAAVIASRDRLDIAAGTVNNRDHALLTSAGDMAFGGALDKDFRATGQGGVLNNDGASAEAGRDALISMREVNNTNRNLVTQTVEVEKSQHHEGVLSGSTTRYDWSQVDLSKKNKYGVHTARMPDGSESDRFYEYHYTRTVTETQIKSSEPGKILAGGDMTFNSRRLTNHDSQIVAGGTLGGDPGETDHRATTGERVTTDEGWQKRWWPKKKKRPVGGTKTSQGRETTGYRPSPVTETTDLKTLAWQGDTLPGVSGIRAGARHASGVALAADATGAASGVSGKVSVKGGTVSLDTPGLLKDRPLTLPSGQTFSLTLPPDTVGGQAITPLIRTVSPDIRLPDNSLFTLHPGTDSRWLVETDPRFVNKKQWLSSDYMQTAFTQNHDNVHKRLGDGYYEQRLVRDQLMQLTGGRYTGSNTNDEAQYRALMDAGIAFGRQYQLTPGVALSPAQMALLTSDMVWLVDRTVTLPDGSTQTVRVPQVYAKLKAGDLRGDGALLGGKRVMLATKGDIISSGSIVGRDVTQLTAGNIINSGAVSGSRVSLQAQEDIRNTGGQIRGSDGVSLLAGRNIISETTTRTDGTNRWTDRPAGIYVENAQGSLSLAALNNLTLTGSVVENQGQGGHTRLAAGNDLTLSTVSTTRTESGDWGGGNWRHLMTESAHGSRITTAGELMLAAGRDLGATAAEVTAGQALTAQAGRDMRLTAGQSTSGLVEHSRQNGRGLLSKTATETRHEHHRRTAQGSLLSGDQVALIAAGNLTVQGSDVVADHDVALSAGNNVDIVAATNTDASWRFKETRKSGLMGTGGIGITVGSSKTTHDLREAGTTQSQSFSTVGSTGGSVSISAGNQLHTGGADLIAAKDLSLSGSSVIIEPGHDKRTRDETVAQKKSGLTVALSGTVGSAVNNAVTSAQDTKKESDGRLKALQATKTALSGVQAGQAADMAATTGDPNAMGVSLSLTTQKSESQQHAESDAVAGSTLNAGNNLSITANGKGKGPGSGDIVIAGSQLKAGGDTLLDAKNDVILSGAASTQQSSGKNSSSGGGVGVSIGGGGNSAGISVFASVNAAHGRDKGNGTGWTETTLDSGKTVTLKSGHDTLLDGAQVNGNKIVADVGHDLLMRSQQDTNDYDSRQTSVAAGGSFTFGTMSGSGYINASQDKMKSRFDSVAEQTGLYAGDGGFDITVGNHTQLDGAVIASTAIPDKNHLDTGTLGFSDIHNEADFKTSHSGISLSGGGSFGDKFQGNMPGGMISAAGNKGHEEGTTQAAVAEGTLTVRNKANQKQDVAALSRDPLHANDSISPIFDKEKEQNRLKEVGMISDIGSQVADIARTQGDLNGLKAARKASGETLPANATEKERQNYLAKLRDTQAYKDEMAKYGTGSDVQRGIQAAVGALQGLAGGNIGAALAGASAPELANIIGHKAGLSEDDIAAKAIAHAILGGVTAALQGNNAAAGAVGAASGELAATAIARQFYPDTDPSKLTEDQKQTVSTLATISAGMAGGIAGGNTADIAAGASAGKNSVENNSLSVDQNQDRIKELSQCQGNAGCEKGITEKYKQLNAEQHKNVVECKGAKACVDKANEVGGLQTAYANRLGELGDKLHSTGSLTTEEKQEWAYLQGVLPQLEADRNAAIHNALMSGDSPEAKQLAINSLAQVAGTSAAGIAAGIGKGGKGSSLPTPTTTLAANGLNYQSNPKHTPGQQGYSFNAGTEPKNSIELFGSSVASGKKRYSIDSEGNVHQFTNTNDGTWHWSGSTGDKTVPLKKSDIPNSVKKEFGLPGKWR